VPEKGKEYSEEDRDNITQVLTMNTQMADRMKSLAVDLLRSTMQNLTEMPDMSQDSVDAMVMPAHEQMQDFLVRVSASGMEGSRLASSPECQALLPKASYKMMSQIRSSVDDVSILSSLMGCVKKIVPLFHTEAQESDNIMLKRGSVAKEEADQLWGRLSAPLRTATSGAREQHKTTYKQTYTTQSPNQ
jgi:hypothetical protein